MKKALLLSACVVAAVSLVLSFGCSKASSDPGQFMITYMKDVIKIVKDNMADCNKAITEVQAYADKNKSALEEVKKAAKEMETKMSEEEKKAYGEKMMKDMEPIMKDNMSVVMEFSQKCPEQAAKLGDAMKFE